MFISAPVVMTAFNNHPSQEDYELCKEYAMIYAKTLTRDVINDDSINISSNLQGNDVIVITVDSDLCHIKAEYPMNIIKQQDGEFVVKILYEDGTYEEHSNIYSKATYILIGIIDTIVLTFIITNVLIFITTNGFKRMKEDRERKVLK